MVEVGGIAVEDEVPGLEVRHRHVLDLVVLISCAVGERNAGLPPGPHREAGAVESDTRGGTTPDVGHATLALGGVDGDLRGAAARSRWGTAAAVEEATRAPVSGPLAAEPLRLPLRCAAAAAAAFWSCAAYAAAFARWTAATAAASWPFTWACSLASWAAMFLACARSAEMACSFAGCNRLGVIEDGALDLELMLGDQHCRHRLVQIPRGRLDVGLLHAGVVLRSVEDHRQALGGAARDVGLDGHLAEVRAILTERSLRPVDRLRGVGHALR